MLQVGETRPHTPEHSDGRQAFFTVVGCMDGRVQDPMEHFGQKYFGVEYPDTITEAGIVGLIANNPSKEFIDGLKFKLLISIDHHHSKGILVDGHQECAGNPVDDSKHIKDIKVAVKKISELIDNKVPVIGVFVKRAKNEWSANQI